MGKSNYSLSDIAPRKYRARKNASHKEREARDGREEGKKYAKGEYYDHRPYFVIGTSPFTGIDTVDECDTLEEAREFAREHGGKVVRAEGYRPQDDGFAPLDKNAYLKTPWLAKAGWSKAE